MQKRFLGIIICAALCVVAYAGNVIVIGSYDNTLDAGYTKFGEPAISVKDEEGHVITSQYKISYSILGGENCEVPGVESPDARGVMICTDAATGTYVEKYYGDVIMGTAGKVKIKVIATSKLNPEDVLTTTYDLTIANLEAVLKFVPSYATPIEDDHDGLLTLTAKRVKQSEDSYYLSAVSSKLPVYSITTRNSGGVLNDITSYFDVNIDYTGSDEITYNTEKGSLSYDGIGNQWNGKTLEEIMKRPKFERLTPVFPDERIRLEYPGCSVAMRIVDLISPIGKGQRGMIVSQPKAGKTTLLKQIAKSVLIGDPKMHLIILLIDERPEEVTDIKEAIKGDNVEVIYSTFDEKPEHHKRVSEMAIERARRLVEHGNDVMILLDSITRLARAYNLTVQPSGRTLSGGLDPAALHMPKRFFGAARNMREGGSLTILATALVDTGSKMDDVVFEEFKGTGNMELVLDRKLSEKRVFPAIDLARSSTRREDLLFAPEELEAMESAARPIQEKVLDK